MDAETGDRGAEAPVALLIADGEGRYFAIALVDLERFRVPAAYHVALESFTRGAEPELLGFDVQGFAESATPDGTRLLLGELFGGPGIRGALPATRMLRVWALLR